MSNRLWLALRLLDLPLHCLPAYPAEQAVCVLEKQKVVAANSLAIDMGVHIGMDATTAHLLSDCLTYQRDLQQEQQHLEQLLERLYAFTPYLHIHRSSSLPESGLLLELSRCLKLFGGLRALCAKIFSTMEGEYYSHGLAHTEQAAWLLSYEGHAVTDEESTSIFMERLNQVPIGKLTDWADEVEALKKTGFVCLGDLAKQINAQSISGLKKRFGRDFAEFITQIFGIEQNLAQHSLFEKPRHIYQPKIFFFDTVQFGYPVIQVDQLHSQVEQMLQKLADFLRKQKLACQRIEWRLFDIYQNAHALSVYSAKPQNHWKLLYELTRIQLEHQQLPFAVDAIELTCNHLQPRQEQNHALNFSGKRQKHSSNDDLALMEAKLTARLGEGSIFKVNYKDSHIPERSHEAIAIFSTAEQQLPSIQQTAPRPTWLFESPFPVKLHQQMLNWRGKLQLLVGPERIEGEWWETPVARDYYVAAREDGLRVWVYRELSEGGWFVQGVFAG